MSEHRYGIDPQKVYFPRDPELRIFGTPGVLKQWRHQGIGPEFIRVTPRRVGYHGHALITYLDDRVVKTRPRREGRQAAHATA